MIIYVVEVYSTVDGFYDLDSIWQSRPNADFRAQTLTNGFEKNHEELLYARVTRMPIEDWTWGA